MQCRKDAGFTLIELSIVLIIVGLIAGGVLVGKELIRAAELRSIVSEADAYKTAVNTFRLKYNCLPGDCPNATSFFEAKANCTDRTIFTATCNGNGNGRINDNTVTSTATTGDEWFLFWQHLALAGLISGNFNGVEGVLGYADVDPDINSPHGKISGSNWHVLYQNPLLWGGGNFPMFKTFIGNHLALAALDVNDTVNGYSSIAIITPAEAFSIDQKIDDGKPATGKFSARYWSVANSITHTSTSCTTATANTEANTDYNLTNTTISCVPQFNNAF